MVVGAARLFVVDFSVAYGLVNLDVVGRNALDRLLDFSDSPIAESFIFGGAR